MNSDRGSRKRIRENSYSVTAKADVWTIQELSLRFIQQAKEKRWYDIFITESIRTKERQQQLYAQWRTRKWKIVTYVDWVNKLSDHQLWIAFDITFRWDTLYPKDNKIRNNLADLATELWLKSWWKEWWWDKVHFWKEYTDIPLEVFQKAEDKHWIKKELLICIVQSETSWWKNIKSKNNVANIGNHDDWTTRDFNSVEENIMELWNVLANWKYLSKWNIIWELSCQWRKLLWRDSCWEHMYASDSKYRHTNVSKCLTKITWKEKDWLRWKYKK